MHIAEMGIDGFGIFQDVHIRDLERGITVFEGHNEAGKTTLMSYIRAILFGFEPRRGTNNRYEPVKGGRHGGTLLLVTDDGKRYRVERLDAGTRGRVSVAAAFPFQQTALDPDGPKSDEEVLQRLLFNTSKLLYQNVFAFGLGELERLDSLQAEEVSSHIYTVGMGTGLVPLTTVQNGLDNEQGQLYKPGGRKPIINQLLQRLDETQNTVRELQSLPDEYYTLHDRQLVLDREIKQFQGQLEEAKRQADWMESLVRARSDWEQLQVVRQELQDLPHIESFPAGGIERLEQLNRSLASLETRLDDTRRSLEKAEEQIQSLHPDNQLLACQTEIEALEEQRGQYKGILETLMDLRSRAIFRRKALDEILSRLGSGWSDTRVDQFEATIPIRERIRGLRDDLEIKKQAVLEALRQQEDVDKTRKEKEGTLERLQEKHEQLTTGETGNRPPLDEREQALRQWFQYQHRLELTQQHHQDLQGQGAVLENQIRVLTGEIDMVEGQQGLPLWLLMLLGLVFAIPGALSGWAQDFFLTITLATCGILAVGLLAWWRHDMRSHRKMRLRKLRSQYKMLVDRFEEVTEERVGMEREEQSIAKHMTSCSQEAIGGDLPSIDSAEAALRSLEAERRMTERRDDFSGRIQDEEEALVQVLVKAEGTGRALKQAEHERGEVQKSWRAFLKGLGLPEELTPDGALEVLSGAERAQVQLSEWRAVTQEMHQVEAQAEEKVERLNAVLGQCGWSPVSLAESSTTLPALRKALEESVSANSECERLSQVLPEKRTEWESAKSEKMRYLEQLSTLLEAGGARDPETFRRRAVHYARQVELERQQRQLEVALRVHAGSAERYKEMEQVLSMKNRAELERELADITREGQQRIGDILTKHLQEQGRVEQQLQDLEQNERLTSAMLEHQMLLAQLDMQAQRWAVKVICQHLLEKARQIYERERQPAVLREASKFFHVMTEGKYVRIMVPLGEMRLEISPQHGVSRTTDILSRGTAEQLYLSMRLAFVREYAKHAGPLPLVVDDIFVNFDQGRAKSAMKILGEIAQTHQVLVFTCHPHVSQWFQETLPGVPIRPIPKSA
jgi:uncharacterized protein YhaN